VSSSQDFPVPGVDHQWNQPTMIDDWGNLPPLDNTENMFQLFDNYLAGNPSSMMPAFEHDMGMFDPK